MIGQFLIMLKAKRIMELDAASLKRYIDNLYVSFQKRCMMEVEEIKRMSPFQSHHLYMNVKIIAMYHN